jgi:Cdc6-like AAA superfamily ATPase
MRTGKDRVQVEAMNVVVNIGDARVARATCCAAMRMASRDSARARRRGAGRAEEIDSIEQRIRALVNEGKTLTEAAKQLGYHQLQSRRG